MPERDSFAELMKAGRSLLDGGKYAEAADEFRKALSADPQSALAHYWLAASAYQLKDWSTAEEEARTAAGLKPQFPEAHSLWGWALYWQAKYDEAITRFCAATDLKPDLVEAYKGWGWALLRGQKDPVTAAEKFRRATELRPEDPESHSGLGYALLGRRDFAAAGETFRRATELNPRHALAYSGWGFALLYGGGKPGAAVEKFQRAAELKPDLPEAYYGWGRALYQQGDLEGSAAKFRRATHLKRDYADAYSACGSAYATGGLLPEAIRTVEEGIQSSPENPYLLHNRASYLSLQGRYGAAWGAWETAVDAYRRGESEAERARNAEYFGYYGNALAMLSRQETAQETYERGLRLDPDNVTLLSALVGLHVGRREDLWLESGMPDREGRSAEFWKAQEAYHTAVRGRLREPATADDYLILGWLHLVMEDYTRSEEALLKACGEGPRRQEAENTLGVLYSRKENYPKAAEHFEAALRIQPSSLLARSNLAESYLRLGLPDKAEAEYKKVLAVAGCHVQSHIGLGQTYTKTAGEGRPDHYEDAIACFKRAIEISVREPTSASRRLKRKELAEVHYCAAYARLKMLAARTRDGGQDLLREARGDVRQALGYDPECPGARRTLSKIDERLRHTRTKGFWEKLAPLLIAGLSLYVFIVTQRGTVSGWRLRDAVPYYYPLLTFGSLVLMIAAASLPQLSRLKVAGVEMEKVSIDQTATAAPLEVSTPSSIGSLVPHT